MSPVFKLKAHSGRIISIINKHLQNLSCIKFTARDKYLITSSDDTLILVWDFNELIFVFLLNGLFFMFVNDVL